MKRFALRSVLAVPLWLMLLAACSLAATKTYVAQAAAVPQIDSITVAGTWVLGDTASVTIGNSTLIVTAGSGTVTTATVADAIKRAINATSLDNNLVSDETRNAAGQLLGEFRDVEAVIDSASTSKVLVRSVVAGVPFGTPSGGNMTVADTAGAGSVTRASVQAATGPWHWNNATNWSASGAPANDDTVVFDRGANGPKFGLPNNSLEVTINEGWSFSGYIGLPLINPLGYTEYRQTYVRLDDAGAGTNIAHRFGISQTGTGSPYMAIDHKTLKCSPIVYATGTPTSGTYALNLCCTANTSTLNILGGSVDYSSQDGGTSAFATVTQSGGTSRGIAALVATADVNMSGGSATIGGTTALDTIQVRGGSLRFENQTATITALSIFAGGSVQYASTATITGLSIFGGTFDAREDAGGFTLTGTSMYGGKFLDPYRRRTIGGSGFNLYFEPSADLQLGASQTQAIGISP